jgi:hypothetical protein
MNARTTPGSIVMEPIPLIAVRSTVVVDTVGTSINVKPMTVGRCSVRNQTVNYPWSSAEINGYSTRGFVRPCVLIVPGYTTCKFREISSVGSNTR